MPQKKNRNDWFRPKTIKDYLCVYRNEIDFVYLKIDSKKNKE